MPRQPQTVAKVAALEPKLLPPLTVLLHSRTVVEKAGFVSTGILTVIEGDMIEIEIGDFKRFDLGDAVKLTVYSPAGIFNFNSTIIARDEGALILINPPENRKRFEEKREFSRVEVSGSAHVVAYMDRFGAERRLMEEPLAIELQNMSLSGLGFYADKRKRFTNEACVEIELKLEKKKLTFLVELVRSEAMADGVFYGGRYTDLNQEQSNSLRAFILKEQVQSHSARKGKAAKENAKRTFK